MKKEDFDLTMESTRCMICKAVPEKPYDGAVVTFKKGELMSESIMCTNCVDKMCVDIGMEDA